MGHVLELFELLFYPVCVSLDVELGWVTDNLVLLSVFVGSFDPVTDVFLHGGVQDEFLADGVPGELPGEHALVAGLFLGIFGVEDYFVVGLDLAVVVFDCVGDSGCWYGHCVDLDTARSIEVGDMRRESVSM